MYKESMDQAPAGQSGLKEFRHDLRIALRAWGDGPLLPLMSLALFAGMAALNDPIRNEGWVYAPFFIAGAIFSVGWYGAERLWYLRLFRDKPFGPGEALGAAFKYFGPFLWLGVLVFFRTLPFFFLALLPTAWEDVPDWTATFIYGVSIDVVATFMTSALAYSTKDSTAAARDGWKMLKDTWPHSAWYVILPPVAITASLQLADIDAGPRVALAGLAALLALWFKGATAAYYLRRHPEVGDYGSLSEAATVSNS